jgi:BirA family biotin operon repressor/biotin-[acetyl-CoA-carboxylase] ligase
MEWSAIPLLTGLSLVTVLTKLDKTLPISLKWPNDLLIGEKKVAGILAEATVDGVIVGIGLNVEMAKSELPVPTATSLKLENFAELNRNVILSEILRNLALTIELWESGSHDLFEQYREASSTLGKEVEIHLPSGEIISSRATGITNVGELQLANGARVNVGDVIHLR